MEDFYNLSEAVAFQNKISSELLFGLTTNSTQLDAIHDFTVNDKNNPGDLPLGLPMNNDVAQVLMYCSYQVIVKESNEESRSKDM